MLTSLHNNIGQALNFNFWNPQGHYNLNLSVPEQREVANTILLLNKQFAAKVKAGELKDRSQFGNSSRLRNEKVAGGSIIWAPDYVLPKMGNFECDFIYMVPNRPTLAEITNEQDIMLLLAWFAEKVNYFKNEAGEQASRISFDGSGLADTFAAISDSLALTTQQLLLFMDLIDGKSYSALHILSNFLYSIDP